MRQQKSSKMAALFWEWTSTDQNKQARTTLHLRVSYFHPRPRLPKPTFLGRHGRTVQARPTFRILHGSDAQAQDHKVLQHFLSTKICPFIFFKIIIFFHPFKHFVFPDSPFFFCFLLLFGSFGFWVDLSIWGSRSSAQLSWPWSLGRLEGKKVKTGGSFFFLGAYSFFFKGCLTFWYWFSFFLF